MKRGLRKYLLYVCLPAALLTAAGLSLLVVARRQTLASQWTAYGRDADRLARSVNVKKFQGERRAAFIWSPDSGLVDSRRLPPSLASALSTTNDIWRAERRKAKPPKIGWMQIGGATVAWRRLPDGRVVGGVMEPFADSAAGQWIPLFGVGFVLVAMCAAALLAGGYSLWRELERERRENIEKTSFLSNATHELKTPLAAIRLWSEMLAGGRLGAERARHAVEVIEEENGRMIRLVENLLDFSRLEQKRRRYREEDVDARKIVDGAVELVHGDFREHGITVAGDAAIPARMDADAVRQILLNLLGNAAKYAAGGGPVDVSAARVGGRIRIEVADRGPGLSEEERAKVFDRFFRGAAAVDSPGGGLGLGLAISRGLAQGMGGNLNVASREGGGCVFILEIPARTPENP